METFKPFIIWRQIEDDIAKYSTRLHFLLDLHSGYASVSLLSTLSLSSLSLFLSLFVYSLPLALYFLSTSLHIQMYTCPCPYGNVLCTAFGFFLFSSLCLVCVCKRECVCERERKREILLVRTCLSLHILFYQTL